VFSFACVLRLCGGSRKTQRPHTNKFYQLKIFVSKTSSSALPLLLPKNYTDAATQSFSRTMLEKRGQNFDRTKILPKEDRYSKGRKFSFISRN